MNTSSLGLAAITLDIVQVGAIIIGAAVALGVAAMIANGILMGRRVKEEDQAKTDLVKEALHAGDKKNENPSEDEEKAEAD